MLLYSPEADALRNILRDAFGLKSVDAGGGWLIFALPPGEIGVHPEDGGGRSHHEISFMCDEIAATVAELHAKGVKFDGEPVDRGWGIVCMMTLPGDVRMMLYQPRHATAIAAIGP